MTATTAAPLACLTPSPTTGISLPCPRCGEAEAAIRIDLVELEGDCFGCLSCDAEFGFAEVRRLVNVWSRVLPRVKALAEGLAADVGAIGEDGMPAAGDE
jgi:hypothetical protein